MRRFICCVGLPASGKSTWTRGRCTGRIARLCRDEIRKELGWISWATWGVDGTVPKEKEEKVTARWWSLLLSYFMDTSIDTIICDDTNLNRQRRADIEAMCRQHGVKFEIKRFDTSVEECVERDRLRGPYSVGEKVIRDMAARYHVGLPKEDPNLQTRFAPVTLDQTSDQGMPLMDAVICDLDGTLSLFEQKGHRGPYDASLCDQDDANTEVLSVLLALHRQKFRQIIYLSGREEKYRPQTMSFFRQWLCPPGPLFMRRTGDMRTDWIVKGELFDAHIRNRYNVRLVLDDRQQVVDFWRSVGLQCWQVAPGQF